MISKRDTRVAGDPSCQCTRGGPLTEQKICNKLGWASESRSELFCMDKNWFDKIVRRGLH